MKSLATNKACPPARPSCCFFTSALLAGCVAIAPRSGGQPAALFAFRETAINDRLGLALDLRNTGHAPATVRANLNRGTD